MGSSVSVESIINLFKDYEIESYRQVFLLRGLKGGNRRILSFSCLSIILLAPTIILGVILFHNFIALLLALILPILIAICGIPMFLRIISDERVSNEATQSWIAIIISYFIFVCLWYLLAFSFDLLLLILPQLLGLITVFLGIEANFTNIVVFILGVFIGLSFCYFNNCL